MKKKLKIAVVVVGITLLLLTGGILWMAKNGVDISTGTCLIADNGRYMIIIDNSPIAMSIRSGDGTIFDGLENGDEILIVHDGIAESYPGRTGVYFCMRLDKGNEIPGDVVMELIDLGWITAETKEEVLQEPPELTISSGGEKVSALKGTYSWNYQNPDGTSTGIESDSMHPLQSKEYMPQLPITYVENSNVDPFYAVLRFDTEPDEVNIRYWTEDCWNDLSAKSQEVKVRPTEVTLENGSRAVKQFNISLERESCIYEVTAKWNSSEQYGGTAYYSFYTTVKEVELSEKLESPEWDMGEMTTQEFEAEGYSPEITLQNWSYPAWDNPILKFVYCGMEEGEFFGDWYYRLEIYPQRTEESPRTVQYLNLLNPIDEDDITVMDVNFDGCQDLVVMENDFSRNCSFRLLTWDQDKYIFAEHSLVAAGFSLDEENQTIDIWSADSATSGQKEIWKWVEEELELIESETVDFKDFESE